MKSDQIITQQEQSSETNNNDIFEMLHGMDVLAALYAAIELEVFEYIRRGCVTVSQIVQETNYESRPIESLLDALTALSFLSKHNETYALTGRAQQILTNPMFVDYIKLAKVNASTFLYPERVKSGEIFPPMSGEWQIINNISSANATYLVDYLVAFFPFLGKDEIFLVDIGCGYGYHLVEFARRNVKLSGIGIDNNHDILEIARKNIQQLDHSKRISVHYGNMMSFDVESAPDVITLFSALRSLSSIELELLVKKIFIFLKPLGHLIIHDFFVLEHRTQPEENVLFDMKLALSSKYGKMFTLSEFEKLQEVGFTRYKQLLITDVDSPVKDSAYHIYQK